MKNLVRTETDLTESSPQILGLAHYNHTYDNKARLASYWHQVDECLALGGDSVLIVGKGSGLPQIMLERQGFNVTTVDIQPELWPTVVGDVQQLPFQNQVFDVAVCGQVLEHLPFECFVPALCELKRVIRQGLVLSLPDRGRCSTLLPRLLRRKVVVSLPNFRLKARRPHVEHFWEVNVGRHRLREVQGAIDEAGLKTNRTFRVWELPYHRFWSLRVAL